MCSSDLSGAGEAVQKLVRGAILRAMKKVAAEFLPPLLSVWAERFGLTYRKVRITAARSRWGSCTSAKTISLSCYLMLVPSHLIDYVILHELAHTREMNHGPRFWELLDSMTAGQCVFHSVGYLFSSCRGRKEMGRPDKVYGERRSIADCVG